MEGKQSRSNKNAGKEISHSTSAGTARSDPLSGILGTTASCKYIKRKLLGQGSFGSAWRVEEASTGRTLAAKVMDLTQMSAKDRGFVTNEVKCLSRCNNPHIVRCEDSVEKDGMLLIVMEYADGGDLYRQIKARQQSMRYFREHEVIFILLQLCIALDHIHSNKMMHRDLKTANILLTTTGLVKLGDFGFSRQYEDSLSNTVGSTFCGTPYYLSPELWHRQMYSKKSEMWSLGVVLYEVMALRRPFGGNNMDELINNICSSNRRPLPNYLSEELVSVCDQLLSVDPAKRPSLRALFQQPFITKNLKTLQHSVERHNRISEQIRAEISHCIAGILQKERPASDAAGPGPRRGVVKRHTAGSGWQDYELALTDEDLTMRCVESGKTETAPLSTLTSVCPIDEPIAGERFVFAVRKHSGKAYWFKVADKPTFEAWMAALQAAVA
ncbi:unnamed protein product [Phytomonas sp. Hart1]|nr:unnamed protein product [Phytomonas sp. Hart1]|eukprot:CCW72014.1 unnamed protein product [Phytomonas sp. isolate Hart1]